MLSLHGWWVSHILQITHPKNRRGNSTGTQNFLIGSATGYGNAKKLALPARELSRARIPMFRQAGRPRIRKETEKQEERRSRISIHFQDWYAARATKASVNENNRMNLLLHDNNAVVGCSSRTERARI
jgi:hypothetical protein